MINLSNICKGKKTECLDWFTLLVCTFVRNYRSYKHMVNIQNELRLLNILQIKNNERMACIYRI